MNTEEYVLQSRTGNLTLYLNIQTGQLVKDPREATRLSQEGTASLADAKDDVEQWAGFPAAQYEEAYSVALQVQAKYGNKVSITGHSLGGGLGALGGLATGLPTFTFNAAGLSQNTISTFDVDPSNAGNINDYYIIGDPVTTGQDLTGRWPAAGNQIPIWADLPWYDYISTLYLEDKLHSIDTVIASLKAKIAAECTR